MGCMPESFTRLHLEQVRVVAKEPLRDDETPDGCAAEVAPAFHESHRRQAVGRRVNDQLHEGPLGPVDMRKEVSPAQHSATA